MEFTESVAILIKSMEYKKDPVKYVEFIRNNRKYFPRVMDKDLLNILETERNKKRN